MMINLAILIMLKYSIFVEEIKFKKAIFDLHVKYDLRMIGDDKPTTITSFLKEYKEVKLNNYPDNAWSYNFNCFSRFQTMPILQFNQAYQTYCRIQLSYDSSNFNYWTNALNEAEYLYIIHDLVDDAFHEHFNLFKRRKALSKLRDLIGEKDFYNGILPPIVPVWRFQLIE